MNEQEWEQYMALLQEQQEEEQPTNPCAWCCTQEELDNAPDGQSHGLCDDHMEQILSRS